MVDVTHCVKLPSSKTNPELEYIVILIFTAWPELIIVLYIFFLDLCMSDLSLLTLESCIVA